MSEEVDIGSLAFEYLAIAAQIEDLESQQKVLKDQITGAFPVTEETLKFEGSVKVQWVKGRRTEKVDPKAAKRGLILAGVEASVVEQAFEKATTVTTGNPYLRISDKEE